MKAVIVDLVGGQAAALCDDGRVVRLKDAGYTLGQIVEVHARKPSRPKWLRYISSVAAAAVLVTAIGGGVAYATPYGVVSLDVNPSLEYTINRFDYVLSVEGVNEDGREMLAGMDKTQLVHRRIDDAIEASVTQLEAGKWLGGESDEILLAAGTKADDHSERLIRELETGLCQKRDGLEVHAVTVSREELDEAHREGMSAGRRRMLHELGESEGAGFVPAEWANRPIRDIFQQLDRGKGQESFSPDMHEPITDTHQEQPGFDHQQANIDSTRPVQQADDHREALPTGNTAPDGHGVQSIPTGMESQPGGMHAREDSAPQYNSAPQNDSLPQNAAPWDQGAAPGGMEHSPGGFGGNPGGGPGGGPRA